MSPVLTLSFVNGLHAGRSLVLVDSAPRTLGRGPDADVVVDDEALAPTHAAVWRDATGLFVRDLGSQTGLFVNDLGVQDARLNPGDRVQMGRTLLVVAPVEVAADAQPQGAPSHPLDALLAWHRQSPRDRVRWALLAQPGTLFALVDVARDPELLDILDASGEDYCALDETREPDDLGDAAPVLVEITPGASTLGTLLEEAWGLGAMVFVTSERPFIEVYRHCLLRAGVDPAAAPVRFWEPAALRTLLDGEGDHAGWFGPVDAYLVEGEGEGSLVRYTPRGAAVQREAVALS